MLILYHISFSFLLVFLNYTVLTLFDARYMHTQNYKKGVAFMISFYLISFHLILTQYKATYLAYFNTLLCVFHNYIHATYTGTTIVERKNYTIDELWHVLNYTVNLYVLHTRETINKNNIIVYDYYYTFYVLLLLAIVTKRVYKFPLGDEVLSKALYYIPAMASAWYIFSLVEQPLYLFFIYLSMYIPVIHVVTSDNIIGRYFLYANVAGSAFVSESLMLLLVENKIA